MIVYRCDRCAADSKSKADLIHVEIGMGHDWPRDSRWLNRADVRLPYIADLCRDCVVVGLLALKLPLASALETRYEDFAAHGDDGGEI